MGVGGRKVIFFPTVCHRWWESLCNANIISHCVGLALQFPLCAKQPDCGVIYPSVEKKTSLGFPWMAVWSAGLAARPAATGPAFTLLIPWCIQCFVLLINSASECFSHCLSLLKLIIQREMGLLKTSGQSNLEEADSTWNCAFTDDSAAHGSWWNDKLGEICVRKLSNTTSEDLHIFVFHSLRDTENGCEGGTIWFSLRA